MSVQLIPMSEEIYQRFLNSAIKSYAEDKVQAGTWLQEESLEKSCEEFAGLLPDGLATKDHTLFSVEHDGEPIGILWLYISERNSEKQAFIYDIELHENERGKGFGKATMSALDDYARSEGIQKISLHVFGHNKRALSLYEKSGYIITDYSMSKRL